MSDKLANITAEEITLGKDGELELSVELLDAVAGGVSPEDTEEESNTGCNQGCVIVKKAV